MNPSKSIPLPLLLAAALSLAAAFPAHPQSPQNLFGGLFAAVQEARIFPDGKEFADAEPKQAPGQILAAYRAEKPTSAAEIQRFVAAHFSLPPPIVPPTAVPEKVSIEDHIDRLWDPLTRSTVTAPRYSSLLTLPRPYVVPGGRFRELYYWDSYFTMLGLVQSGRQDLVRNLVDDFAYLIDTYGHVPNGARTYYLSRSQPPFFFEMVGLLGGEDAAAGYARYLPELRREYEFWMDGASRAHGGAVRRVVVMPDGTALNRFWDDSDQPRDESYREDTELARVSGREPRLLYRDIRAAAESGWDFGSRWFADGRTRATLDTTEIVPIDLNSLLYGLERAIVAGCDRTQDVGCVRDFTHRAARRRTAIDRYLWDEKLGAYADYRFTRHERVARLSAATLYPLFVGLAPPRRAAVVATTTARLLLKTGGVVTTLADTGQQWDSPNGWAPLQWIAVDGLRRYHHDSLAATVACRWMASVNLVYRERGKLVEKYDVMDPGSGGGGEYPTQDGFGWTNGVMRKLAALYPAESGYATAADCAPANDAAAPASVK